MAFRSAGDHARSLGALAEAQPLYRARSRSGPDDADLPHLWIALAEVQTSQNPTKRVETATDARDLCGARTTPPGSPTPRPFGDRVLGAG